MNKWSGDVRTTWHPPEGLFTKSASVIAAAVLAAHKDQDGARKAIDFYMNRAGDTLSQERKNTLEKAKRMILGESSLRMRSYLPEEFSEIRAVNIFTNDIARKGPRDYRGLFIVRDDRKQKGNNLVLNVSATKVYASFRFEDEDENKIHVIVDPEAVFKKKKDHGVVSRDKAIKIIQEAISDMGMTAPSVGYGRRF